MGDDFEPLALLTTTILDTQGNTPSCFFAIRCFGYLFFNLCEKLDQISLSTLLKIYQRKIQLRFPKQILVNQMQIQWNSLDLNS